MVLYTFVLRLVVGSSLSPGSPCRGAYIPSPSVRVFKILALRGVLEPLLQLGLEQRDHRLLNHDILVVEDLDDELVVILVIDADYDGLDRCVALDKNAWEQVAGQSLGFALGPRR